MTQFGLALTPGPLKGEGPEWLAGYEAVLPQLAGHIAGVWMPDHFFWKDTPTYEAMTVLTYFAARFPDFTIGSSVLGQSYRNPGLLAKMAATLDALSDGRFILGLGAGWKEDEYVAYGYPFPRAGIRLRELDEALTIIRRLWQEPGPVSFDGEHYRLVNAYAEPRPDPPPPIVIGGGGKKTMRLAARHADWWNLSDAPIEKFRQRQAILADHCAELGRDFDTLRQTWFGRLVVADTMEAAVARAERDGRSHYAGWTVEGALVGTAEDIIEQAAPFIEAGVDYFMLEIIGIDETAVRSQVVDAILPAIREL